MNENKKIKQLVWNRAEPWIKGNPPLTPPRRGTNNYTFLHDCRTA
jgi:hypothetical protein